MLSSSEFYSGSSGGGAGDKYVDVSGLSPLSVDVDMSTGLSLLNQTMNTLSGGSLSDPWSNCSPLSQKSPDTDLVHQMDALLKTEPLDLPCASPSDVELLQMSLQADQSELLQGPTLAELNAPPTSDLLDDLCFDDLMLPEESLGRSRWDTSLGMDTPSSGLGGAGSDLPSAALGHLSSSGAAGAGMGGTLSFDPHDFLTSGLSMTPRMDVPRQVMLGSSMPAGVTSVDIGGHRFILTNPGTGAPSVVGGLGGIGNASQLTALLSAPVGGPNVGPTQHDMSGMGRPIKSETGMNTPALSSSVPSTCGFTFSPSITTTSMGMGQQHQLLSQTQSQAHQAAASQQQQQDMQQLQLQQMQQLNLLASNLATPSKPCPLTVSPQQPVQQIIQPQVCLGMMGTTGEAPSTSSRRSSSASLCSDGISKLTLHNNILHQNRSKAPHQMRPRASTMSGAIGHRRPPKASSSGASGHQSHLSAAAQHQQQNSGLMKNNCLLASTPDIRLSSSCPSNAMDMMVWRKAREPRQHLLSGGSLIESPSHGGSGSSLSTGGVLSPGSGAAHDMSFNDDEYFNSESEDDDEESDGESGGSGDDAAEGGRSGGSHGHRGAHGGASGHGSHRDRYFWQYNVQAKGPKGQRLVLKKPEPVDPHILDQVVDPVFNPVVAAQGIRHSGKARRGDGNDLTPSPRKLYNIGVELDGLNQAINEMTPVAELPYNDRPKSRKEKNKLASRACRLKKKAQHEANKLTLYGLQEEHRKLMECIEVGKKLILARLASVFGEATGRDIVPIDGPISPKLEAYCDPVLATRVAGRGTEFVNTVLEKVKAGIPNGGLNTVFK